MRDAELKRDRERVYGGRNKVKGRRWNKTSEEGEGSNIKMINCVDVEKAENKKWKRKTTHYRWVWKLEPTTQLG